MLGLKRIATRASCGAPGQEERRLRAARTERTILPAAPDRQRHRVRLRRPSRRARKGRIPPSNAAGAGLNEVKQHDFKMFEGDPCQVIVHEGKDDEAVVKAKALAEHIAAHPEDAGLTVKDFRWMVHTIVKWPNEAMLRSISAAFLAGQGTSTVGCSRDQTHVMAERCEPAADVMGARGMRHAGR
jgi:hypothetical protein